MARRLSRDALHRPLALSLSLADSRDTGVTRREVVELLSRLDEVGVDFVKTENLCSFDGEPGYSAGHTH